MRFKPRPAVTFCFYLFFYFLFFWRRGWEHPPPESWGPPNPSSPPAFPSCFFRCFPGGFAVRGEHPPVWGGSGGQRIPGQIPAVPKDLFGLCESDSRKGENPSFYRGMRAPRSLSKRNAEPGGRGGLGPKIPVPWRGGSAGFGPQHVSPAGRAPAGSCSRVRLPEPGEKKKLKSSPHRPIPSPPAAPSSSTWLAQVFHVNDSNKYLIMSRSYRRLAEQPALMRHPGEGGRKKKKSELPRKKVFSALPERLLNAEPGGRTRGGGSPVPPEGSHRGSAPSPPINPLQLTRPPAKRGDV